MVLFLFPDWLTWPGRQAELEEWGGGTSKAVEVPLALMCIFSITRLLRLGTVLWGGSQGPNLFEVNAGFATDFGRNRI